jgi:isopenicillin-N epimerase
VRATQRPDPSPLARHWALDPEVVFLNHGSFGATPHAVLDRQGEIRSMMEAEPLQFFDHTYQRLLDEARRRLGDFVGASPSSLALICNATTGVNTVLRSLRLEAGDELLVTDHEYNACRNAIDAVAEASGCTVRVARVAFPLRSEDEVVEAVLDLVGARTRLVLVDHVTSQTGLVLPLERLVTEVQAAGADVLVDGAHAPGMIALDLDRLGAAYYTGNCHKWVCAPKGAAFLYVRDDLTRAVRPLVISHGANAESRTRSAFHLEHDWTGTRDPSASFCIPDAITTVGGLVEGGWTAVRERNRELALEGRDILCRELGLEPPCPDRMLGSLASIPLPDGRGATVNEIFPFDELQVALYEEYRIEVPVIAWPARPRRLLRLSAQLYNSPDQYRYLAAALRQLL